MGQPAALAPLRSSIASGRPHHAYLFDGPEGVGKRTTALAFAAAVNCEAALPTGEACGQCLSCQKISANTHPDVMFPKLELSGLAETFEKLLRRLQYPPFEAKAQVVILDPADQLAFPTALTAANRLLKTLEEPQKRTHFFLCSTSANGLLETIRSRCLRLRFLPLQDDLVAAWLRNQAPDLSPEVARQVVALSLGSLGQAQRLLAEPALLQKRQSCAEALLGAVNRPATQLCQVAAEVGQDKDEAQKTLDVLWLKLHGQLRQAAQNRQQSTHLVSALRLVRETQLAISRFTGAPLAIERLLRKLLPLLQNSSNMALIEGVR